MVESGQFDLSQFWVSTFFLDDLGQLDLGQLAEIVDVRVLCCGVHGATK